MGLLQVPCDYCGQSRYHVKLVREPYCVVRCQACGLDYLTPRPDDETLTKLYTEAYFDSENFSENLVETDANSREKVVTQQAYLLRYIQQHYAAGDLLEIGCAAGHFLELAARSGFSVKGIEFSESAAKLAREFTKAPVLTGDLQLALQQGFVQPDSLDVVVMCHVLEHMKSPKITLQQIFSGLKSQGIAVIRVPDFGGFDAWLKGKNWEGLRIPYHFYHFRPETLRRYLESTGFEVLEFDYWIHGTIAQPLSKLKRLLKFLAHLLSTKHALAPSNKSASASFSTLQNSGTSLKNTGVKQWLYLFRGRTMTFVVKKP